MNLKIRALTSILAVLFSASLIGMFFSTTALAMEDEEAALTDEISDHEDESDDEDHVEKACIEKINKCLLYSGRCMNYAVTVVIPSSFIIVSCLAVLNLYLWSEEAYGKYRTF